MTLGTPSVMPVKAAKIGDTTVEQTIADLSAKIGEKLELRRAAYFDGTVETYLHKRAADLPPAVGVLVEYAGSNKDAAHAVALQIAALKAKFPNAVGPKTDDICYATTNRQHALQAIADASDLVLVVGSRNSSN